MCGEEFIVVKKAESFIQIKEKQKRSLYIRETVLDFEAHQLFSYLQIQNLRQDFKSRFQISRRLAIDIQNNLFRTFSSEFTYLLKMDFRKF